MKRLLKVLLVVFIFIMTLSTVDAASPKLNATSLTLQNVRSYTLKVKNTSKSVKWSSSNKKVATVSSKGKVSAVKNGTCTIGQGWQ